jgi:hypothetical protein
MFHPSILLYVHFLLVAMHFSATSDGLDHYWDFPAEQMFDQDARK